MTSLKLIATYSRVSTARQEEEQTIQNQIVVLREFAKKGGYTIVKEYSDDGWSGDTLARPSLDELRSDAKKKLWEAVLIYDPDRLARRYSYQELIMDELKEADIEMLFITVSTPKNSEDKILQGVRGLFAEYERAKISERFRLGKVRKVKEGNLLVSEPLYGYTYFPKVDNVHGYYIVNEEEARIIKMIFKWFDEETITLRGVTKRLLELNIKPRRSKRGVWNTSTLSTMLRNKGYIGEAHWGSTYAVVPSKPLNAEKYKRHRKTSRKVKPVDEWFTIPIPPLVDREIFQRVQDKLHRNFLLSVRNTKNEYLLTGIIKCSCGRSRGGEGPQKGKHLYYRCTDRSLSHPLPPTCKEKALNARIVDKIVWEELTRLLTSPELIAEQLERFENSQVNKIQNSVIANEQIMLKIKKFREEEERYNKAYGSGVFSVEQLVEYTSPIKAKIKGLEKQMIKQDKNVFDRFTNSDNRTKIEEFMTEENNLLNLSFASKKAIVRSVIDKIVGDKDKLLISGYIPVKNINVKTSYRHRQDITRHFQCHEIPFSLEIDLDDVHINGQLNV